MTEVRERKRNVVAATGVGIAVPDMPDVIMGVDPSLTSTGIVIITRGKMEALTLKPPKVAAQGATRLAWFFEQMTGLIHKHRVTAIGIEGYSFGSKNGREALGELGGVLRLSMHRAGFTPLVVPPTSMKKFITGSGNAEKSTVSKEIFKRFKVDLTANDQVDAAGIGIVTLAFLNRERFTLTAFQSDALSKIE
jgi:crossover junction endodeoxyribonuclease RuvC